MDAPRVGQARAAAWIRSLIVLGRTPLQSLAFSPTSIGFIPGDQTPNTAFFFAEVRCSVIVWPLFARSRYVIGSIPPLSLGPPVVRPFKTTVVRPGGNFTRMFFAQTVPAIKSIPASTKSETRFIDCPFKTELRSVKDRYFVAAVDVKHAFDAYGALRFL